METVTTPPFPLFVQLPANFFHFPFLKRICLRLVTAQKVLHFACLIAAFDGKTDGKTLRHPSV